MNPKFTGDVIELVCESDHRPYLREDGAIVTESVWEREVKTLLDSKSLREPL